jgi:hypothetical protein
MGSKSSMSVRETIEVVDKHNLERHLKRACVEVNMMSSTSIVDIIPLSIPSRGWTPISIPTRGWRTNIPTVVMMCIYSFLPIIISNDPNRRYETINAVGGVCRQWRTDLRRMSVELIVCVHLTVTESSCLLRKSHGRPLATWISKIVQQYQITTVHMVFQNLVSHDDAKRGYWRGKDNAQNMIHFIITNLFGQTRFPRVTTLGFHGAIPEPEIVIDIISNCMESNVITNLYLNNVHDKRYANFSQYWKPLTISRDYGKSSLQVRYPSLHINHGIAIPYKQCLRCGDSGNGPLTGPVCNVDHIDLHTNKSMMVLPHVKASNISKPSKCMVSIPALCASCYTTLRRRKINRCQWLGSKHQLCHLISVDGVDPKDDWCSTCKESYLKSICVGKSQMICHTQANFMSVIFLREKYLRCTICNQTHCGSHVCCAQAKESFRELVENDLQNIVLFDCH